MLNNGGVQDVCLNWRPSWMPSWIAQFAQGCQGGIMQILNLDILIFHFIPRTKLQTTFEGSPKNVGFSAGLNLPGDFSCWNSINNWITVIYWRIKIYHICMYHCKTHIFHFHTDHTSNTDIIKNAVNKHKKNNTSSLQYMISHMTDNNHSYTPESYVARAMKRAD
jgi:hypothetical protein